MNNNQDADYTGDYGSPPQANAYIGYKMEYLQSQNIDLLVLIEELFRRLKDLSE